MQLMHIVQLIVHRIAVAVVLVPLAEAEVVSPEAAEAEADKIKKTWKNEMNLPVSYTHLDVYKRQAP